MAWIERNFWADPALLKRCILRSRRRAGLCEFSARLFSVARAQPRSIPSSPNRGAV